MPLQALPADPSPTIGPACVLEGAAKTIPFDQLPEPIRADLKRRTPDLWVPGPVFDVASAGAPFRFVAAARLEQRYVAVYEHDGWSRHVTLLAYDMASADVTPQAEWSFEDSRPTCQALTRALKAPLYPKKP